MATGAVRLLHLPRGISVMSSFMVHRLLTKQPTCYSPCLGDTFVCTRLRKAIPITRQHARSTVHSACTNRREMPSLESVREDLCPKSGNIFMKVTFNISKKFLVQFLSKELVIISTLYRRKHFTLIIY